MSRPAPVIALPVPWLRTHAPDATALRVTGGQSVTYRDLGEDVNRAAQRLAKRLDVGDRVALLADNGYAWAVAVHAVAAAGGVLVPLNTRLTQDEVAWQLGDAEAAVVLVDAAHRNRVPGPNLQGEGGRSERPGAIVLDSLIAMDSESATPADVRSGTPQGARARERQGQPDGDGGPKHLRSVVSADDPAVIMYTSGTTGRPKGAVLTFGNLAWSASASALRLGHDPADRWLVAMPLFHVGGLSILWRTAFSGTSAVIQRGFDPETVLRSLATDRITLVSFVPTMLHRLLEHAEAAGRGQTLTIEAPDLRAVLLGGGPATQSLIERGRLAGLPLAPTYGLTEAASQVATAAPSSFNSRAARGWPTADHVGYRMEPDPYDVETGEAMVAPPLPFVDVAIAQDEADADLDGDGGADEARVEGEPTRRSRQASRTETHIGEILVRGPTVMAGYWRNESATAQALAGGWLHTGDIGRLTPHGQLVVLGRRGDLIVTGGENVYPAEVEAVLVSLSEVAEAAVVGLPDSEWGQRVTAAVVLVPTKGPVEGAAERIEAGLRDRLAGYKVPRQIQVVDELPRLGSGKVNRAALRTLLASHTD